ncbi:MAG: TonB-dependent receptor [Bacteroidia bacterium]
MRYLFTLIGSMLICLTVNSQNTLNGRVVNATNNQPLAGATIKATQGIGTISDNNGNFSIDCNNSTELTVTFIGYNKYQQAIKNCNEEVIISLIPSSENLNEIEIISNSNKSSLYQPTSIAKLNVKELKRGTGLFLDDAINANVPGVFMEKRTISAGQQFNIRGYGNGLGFKGVTSNFDGQGSKIYLNNIPVTDAEGITVMDDIDFGSIGNVEVIKGPAGSLYGLAIAGVVKLKTVQAEKGKVSIAQDAMIGSYGLSRYTSHVMIGGERSSVLINYGKQKYNGFMKHTASTKDFVNFIGEFQPNAKQSFNAYFGYSNSYDERNGELTIKQYESFDYSGNPSYIKNNAHSEVISFRAGVGHTYAFNKHFSNTTSLFGTGINSSSSSASNWTDRQPLNCGLRSVVDIKSTLSENFRLAGVVGVETQIQYAQTIAYGMVPDSANLNGYNIIGAMRSNQATISKTTSVFTEWVLTMPYDFSLTAGIGSSTMGIQLNDRFYVPANNKSITKIPTAYKSFYKDMYSPHIALNKVFSNQLSAYISYSKGYRAPVSSYFFIPTTGELNTGLRPEVGNQYEIGTKGSLLNGKFNYQLAVFNTIFSNKMTTVAVPLNNSTTAYTYVVNGGAQDDKGLEALVKYTVHQSNQGVLRFLEPYANFCYSDFKYKNYKYQTLNKTTIVEYDYSGKVVAGVPPVTFNAGIDFAMALGFYGNVNYSYRDGIIFTSDGLNKTNSYNLLNAKLGIRQSFLKHFEADVYVGANNITSTQYYYMVFLNQLPDAYLAAPKDINYFGGIALKYNF